MRIWFLAVICILLFGCVAPPSSPATSQTDIETSPAPAESAVPPFPEQAPPVTERIGAVAEPEPAVTYPRKNISLYLGVWMPSTEDPEAYSLSDPEDIVEIGANTIAFGVGIPYDEEGEIDPARVQQLKQIFWERTRQYKEAGLVIIFSPEPVPAAEYGEPGPVPATVREEFIDNYNEVIVEFARIAEEENVEVFSPMNEPDYKLGVERSSSWGQEILPGIKAIYTGKVMWKGALAEQVYGPKPVDFSGYDIVGFTIFPFGGMEHYPQGVEKAVATLKAWAREDNVNEVLVSEFGNYAFTGIAKSDEPRALQTVFEEGEGKLDGFIVFDPPRGFGTPIRGSGLEEVVREWFERLDLKTANN